MQRIVIIDYGSGNLHSAAKAFERAARESGANAGIAVSSSPREVEAADRIVLPGVGAFADCQQGLAAVPGMIEALQRSVREKGRPFLGICVGAQLMAERGLEFKITPGLGWIKGDVKAIQPNDPTLKIPHMGWNTLNVITPHALLANIKTGVDGLHAYFVHSFHLATRTPGALVAETRLRWTGDRDGGGRQHRGHTVPSGKEPDAWTSAHRQLSEVAALREAALPPMLAVALGGRAATGDGLSFDFCGQAAFASDNARNGNATTFDSSPALPCRLRNQRKDVLSSTASVSTCWIKRPSSLSR